MVHECDIQLWPNLVKDMTILPDLNLRDAASINICVAQEVTGVVLTGLVEDPEGATIEKLAAEAAAALAGPHAAGPEARAELQERGQSSMWIAPAPSLIKLRLFCLPYAGGVSENVFAR